MPSSVCSVAPWTTFSRAPDANNARSAGRPAVSAKSVARQRSVSAQWSCSHGIPPRASE
jgi:hypothetical protein